MDPDPALFAIYGSGYRLFYDTKIMLSIFFKKIFRFISYIFHHEGIPLKEMKKLRKEFEQI